MIKLKEKIESKFLDQFSIITITFNDNSLKDTFLSYKDLLIHGAQLIVVNGGDSLDAWCSNFITNHNVLILEEPDKGRYDALNKGIALVKTKYFMLIHGGDRLTISCEEMSGLLSKMQDEYLDLIIGNQFIDFHGSNRRHTVTYWKPFMTKLGAQPPHMPIIYRSAFVESIKYDYNSNIIADHIYLFTIFEMKPKWLKSNLYHIKMLGGGVTSSGFGSFITVSNEFIKTYGLFRGILMTLARIPLKLVQMI